jgi:arylsulfatase A-like enzyme
MKDRACRCCDFRYTRAVRLETFTPTSRVCHVRGVITAATRRVRKMKLRYTGLAAILATATLVGGCDDDSTGDTTADMATAADMAQGDDLSSTPAPDMASAATPTKKVIVFVWDGLRPDSVTMADTPNLYALKMGGVDFQDNHSTYPTFTMMNSAAFATGSFPQTTGFYGNTLYAPGGVGGAANGSAANFTQPAFTEDWGVLQALDNYYGNKLLLVSTLFQAAQAKGLTTAAVGKSGAAFLQDYRKGGYIVEENMIWPLSLVKEIQGRADVLPANTPFAYAPGQVTMSAVNGTPTATPARAVLADKATGDPTAKQAAPPNNANTYMMETYLTYVLPKAPDLTLIWFRSPDSPEHNHGPGSPTYKDALHNQDFQLGQLQAALKAKGWDKTTDIIIVSDHGHSNVSGPLALFPLRAIASGAVGAKDPNGWSVSGDVRLADILTKAGIANVFDGNPCLFVPTMSGLKDDGSPVYTTTTFSAADNCNNSAAGTVGAAAPGFTTKSYVVPSTLPAGAVIIAANGGSDYIYLTDRTSATAATLMQSIVTALQKREEVGAIFVNNSRWGAVAGTLPMSMIKVEAPDSTTAPTRAPDIILSYDYDADAMVAGMPGIEFESMASGNNRGMHGSFSPRDVHNTLLATGPDFKTTFADTLPTGNVDVAPTVARIFGLALPGANGRPLLEALVSGGAAITDYTAAPSTVHPANPATCGQFQLPTDPTPNPATVDSTKTGTYTIDLNIKTLTKGSQTWTYFDSAKAVRQ